MCRVDPTSVPAPPPTLNSRFTKTFTHGAVKKCLFVDATFNDIRRSKARFSMLSEGTGMGTIFSGGGDDVVEGNTGFSW